MKPALVLVAGTGAALWARAALPDWLPRSASIVVRLRQHFGAPPLHLSSFFRATDTMRSEMQVVRADVEERCEMTFMRIGSASALAFYPHVSLSSH